MNPSAIDRRFQILLVACLGVVGAVVMMAAPAFAIDQGGIGGRPAYPKDNNSRSQSIFIHTLSPGEQAKDGVEVINNTGETKRVLVYAVDSQISSGGAFACAQAVDESISVGRWIAIGQKEVTLNAGAKQFVDFTITAPKDAVPGEHDGCIVIQDTKQQTAPDSNGIVLSMRSAIRVAVTVPGDIQKGLVFTGLGMQSKAEDKVLLSTALKNNGNVSLDTLLDVRLMYPFGLTAAKTGGNFPVLSNSEGRFNFESSRPFWGGWYRLTATAHYNDDPNTSLGEGKATTNIKRQQWIYVAPDPFAAIIEGILLVGLVGGTAFLIRKRRHHTRAMRRARKHTVSDGEDLPTIAHKYHMSWKRLARLNKLKPPYQLKNGQTLIVTPPDQKPQKKLQSRP